MTAAQLDLVALARRAEAAAQGWRKGTRVGNVRPLTGGASSLTFLADASGDEGATPLVLKVAPPGLEPVRNRDILRQGRLMRALRGRSGVTVPDVYFDDAGDPPGIPPMLAMSLVPGSCFEPLLEPRSGVPSHAEVRERAVAAARMLAALHRLVPDDIGLGVEPVVTLQDEIDRWTRAFTTVPDDLRTGYEQTAAALHATAPPAMRPAVNHGDYRLGNTLCEGGTVESIIDWEIWSVGDPRVDVTWFMYFTDDAGHPASPSDEPCGMPSSGELRDLYEQASGRPLVDLDWFVALTRYKEAAATALLIKRARKSGNAHSSFERMEPALPSMIREARDIVESRINA